MKLSLYGIRKQTLKKRREFQRNTSLPRETTNVDRNIDSEQNPTKSDES